MKRILTRINITFILVISVLGLVFPAGQTASAAVGSDFQAGNIINDSIFFNSNTMSVGQIQAFLNAKVPSCRAGYTCLKSYSQATPGKDAEAGLCNTYNGGTKSSAQIIYDVARACGINPQVILTTLQKEQSLITDDWPDAIQYRSAMGYGCPDTAACDSTYYGFFNQVYMSSRQWRLYAKNPSSYNYRTGRNNTILWNPSASCGSSQVFIYSQATAGLYNYTPYRPNQAALNNLYGLGDSCSSYGNRNFWRLFTDWFGSTTGGVGLVRANSGGTTYAWYDGKKQGIPTPDVLSAWGLDTLPVILMDDASLATIPERPTILTRVAKNPYTNGLYLLADGGGTYDSFGNMLQNWGYDPAGASEIDNALIASTGRLGGLSAFVTAPSAGGIAMVDNGTKRLFSTSDIFTSWSSGSQVNAITDTLFNLLTSGSGIFSNQVQAQDGRNGLMSQGSYRSMSTGVAGVYPRSQLTNISNQLTNVLRPGGEVTQFVKGSGGTIYLVDNGTKHGIISLDMLMSYASGRSPQVTTIGDQELSTISTGATVNTRFAYNISTPTTQFYVNGQLHTAPGLFNVSSYGFAMSSAGLSLITNNNAAISCTQGLVQAQASPGIYILDQGVRRGIASLDMLSMIKNNAGNICILNPEDVNVMPVGSPISTYVSNSGTNYLLEQNNRYTLAAPQVTALGTPTFIPVSNSFIANYTNSGALTSQFRAGVTYGFIQGGKSYRTDNQTIASLWGVSAPQQHSSLLLKFLPGGDELIPFAKSTDPSIGAIFLVDNGKFLPISSLDHLFNAGFDMRTIPSVSTSYLNANLGTVWQGYLAKDSSNNQLYVLEGGKKHIVPNDIASNWLGTTSPITPTTLSPDYLNLLATGPTITKSVETNNPGIYGINDGKKAGIPNIQTFNALYRPATRVTTQLINSIPNGPPIPSI